MANSSGVSGPFNPAIGLGTTNDKPIIGVAAANINTVIANTPRWGHAALGNFIGVQRVTAQGYRQVYGEQFPPTYDFDPTFRATVVSEASPVQASEAYRTIDANGRGFGFTPNVATTQTTTITTNNAVRPANDIVTVNVKNQAAANQAGQQVVYRITGGTAAAGASVVAQGASAPNANVGITDASGNSTAAISATVAGTVIVQATVNGIVAQTATATFT